ncbi:MAG: HAD family hydrolase [Clostridia bacterium]|nr:HAD family hydrolase [Clostridia bacterium]
MIILHEHKKLPHIDAAVFDFDGTLSELRTGWESVMEPLMVECIPGDRDEITARVRAYIDESTGIQTIHQMRWLSDQVAKSGGKALDPWDYKTEYNRRLMVEVGRRRQSIADGRASRGDYLVPGAEEFLAELCAGGTSLYAASGTDDADVKAEAAILGLDRYFAEIAGAPAGSDRCSKEAVLERLMTANRGANLLVVGDGRVEIALGRDAGALTLGICYGKNLNADGLEADKARRLTGAGAHALVYDFTNLKEILTWI